MATGKLTTLIVDAEAGSRDTLRRFLEEYCPDVMVVGEAASVHEAVLQIATYDPALVFLDINMPYESGLGLFTKIPEPDFHTILVTAQEAYALDAIKCHVLDYILKPVNADELITAVTHALKLSAKAMLAAAPIHPAHSAPKPRKSAERLALPVADGYIYTLLSEIVRCEASGNYTTFHFANHKKLLVCRTLGSYEEQLRAAGFMRVHHHHLVNITHVEKYQRGRGGIITMSDKVDVAVSQRRKDDFLRVMEQGWQMAGTA